jgi:hypothetical protein
MTVQQISHWLTRMTANGLGAIALAALIPCACALKQPKVPVVWSSTGGHLGTPVARFPSKQDLQGRSPIANSESANSGSISTMPTERWEIKSKIPSPGSSYANESRWDKLLLDALAGREVNPSPALRCAAEEASRFFVANAAFPDEQLQRYLVARCGSSLVYTSYGTYYAVAMGTPTEERIERELGGGVRKLIDQVLATAPNQVGLGYSEGSGRVAFVLFTGQKSGSLNEIAPLVEANRVNVSGVLPNDPAYILGMVTQGAYGFRRCEPDRSVQAPRFKMSCPVHENDSQACIEVAGRRADEVLWNTGLRLLVRRDESAGLVYQPHPETSGSSVGSSGDYTQSVPLVINEIRRKSGRPMLELLPAQSQTNRELTAYLFDASRARDSQHVTFATLGMLAGWDVPGMIRDGGIYWSVQNQSPNAQTWLDSAIESPFGRWVLLDANMSRLAVGTRPMGKLGMVTLVTTYALFDSSDHRVDEDAVFKEVSALRRAQGLANPVRVARGSALTNALAKFANPSKQTQEITGELLQELNLNARHPASVYVVETNSLFHFTAPETLFKESLALEVGVTHYKAAGGAWGQYVLYFVLHDARDSQPKVALSAPANQLRPWVPN